jgi:hypothetical protein
MIFALRVGRTSDLTGLPKTLDGRGGRGFHGALTTAPPAPRSVLLNCSPQLGRSATPARQTGHSHIRTHQQTSPRQFKRRFHRKLGPEAKSEAAHF